MEETMIWFNPATEAVRAAERRPRDEPAGSLDTDTAEAE